MVRCARAVGEDIPALKALWLSCFDEKPQAVNLFFERTREFTYAYKATIRGQIIAAVYCVSCMLRGHRAHYLCGVATHPDHRGRGVMHELLYFALADAENRGDAYSVLFPANKGLYRFYEDLGYESRCKVTQTVLLREELSESVMLDRVFPDTDGLQSQCFHDKFLYWNQDFIRFAIDYYAVYGVETLYSADALAIVSVDQDVANVLYAVYRDFDSLKKLLFPIKAERYILKQPGKDVPYGMIKPLGKHTLPDNVWIGITLN